MKRIVALLLFCLALLQGPGSWAQGAKNPLRQAAIDTAFLLPVNGVKQYLEIKGASKTKPVLLFIHGVPPGRLRP